MNSSLRVIKLIPGYWRDRFGVYAGSDELVKRRDSGEESIFDNPRYLVNIRQVFAVLMRARFA